MLKHASTVRIAQAWLLMLVLGSLQPVRPGLMVGAAGAGWHRGMHFLAFAGATLLLLVLARDLRQEIRNAMAVSLLGLSLEYLQHLIYRSPMEWWDVRDDGLAILAAFAVYQVIHRCKPTPAPPGS
jgi:hypothetical protein